MALFLFQLIRGGFIVPDISKVNINAQVYNLKDIYARNKILEIEQQTIPENIVQTDENGKISMSYLPFTVITDDIDL